MPVGEAPRSEAQGEASGGEGAHRPGAMVSSHAAAQGANAMGKILELSDDTYQQLVDLAQQQQRTGRDAARAWPRMRRPATSGCTSR